MKANIVYVCSVPEDSGRAKSLYWKSFSKSTPSTATL